MKVLVNYEKFLENQRDSDMWNLIPDSVKELHRIFQSNGKKLFVVGGSVRDFLIGDQPKDFDLATDAVPDEVVSILKSEGYSTNLQGKAFGVVVVYTDDQPLGMEIATFREDIYASEAGKTGVSAVLGTTRNPDVRFTTIENDVKRRDIPFNALFYDLDTKSIVDLVGGMDDIKNRVARFLGDPELRIKEDPLRILRLIRFAFRYSFSVDPKSLDAIRDRKNDLNIISRERIWEEIKKAHSYTKKKTLDFNSYLQYFTDLGLWDVVFPGCLINTDLIDSSNMVVILANLFRKEDPKILERKLVQEFKIEGDVADKSVFLISLLGLTPDNVFEMYKRKIKCHIDNSVILEWLDCNLVRDRMFRKFVEYVPTVSADDLMSSGIRGKALGEEIKRLETEEFKKMIV